MTKEQNIVFDAIINRFKENRIGFWVSYRWLIGLFVIAVLCDAASTIYFMLEAGPEYADMEMHPFISFCSRIFGPVGGPLVGAAVKIAAAIPVAIYCRKIAVHIFVGTSFLFFWAGWYNIWGYDLYTPNILRWLSF